MATGKESRKDPFLVGSILSFPVRKTGDPRPNLPNPDSCVLPYRHLKDDR